MAVATMNLGYICAAGAAGAHAVSLATPAFGPFATPFAAANSAFAIHMTLLTRAQLSALIGILGTGVERSMDDLQFMCGMTCDADDPTKCTGGQPCEDMYDDRETYMRTMGDFSHPDSHNLVMASLERSIDSQGPVVLSGLVDCIALCCAIGAMLSLKAQMSYNRKEAADEKELIAFFCLILGFVLPILVLALQSGPMSFVGWVGGDAVRCARDPSKCGDAFWKNFTDADFRAMWMSLSITEALFTWITTLTAALQAVGFFLLIAIAPTKAKALLTPQHNTIGLAIACLCGTNFFCGVMREASWFFEIGVLLSDALLLFIAFPAWFVLLALALKKVDSIESMNVGLFTNAEAEDAKRRELAMGGAPAATEPAAPPPTAL